MVFNRDEIRGKATNVAEIDREETRQWFQASQMVVTRIGADVGGICGPPPLPGDSEAGVRVAIEKKQGIS